MVVPRFFSAGPLRARMPDVVSLSELPRPQLSSTVVRGPQLYRWTRPCFSPTASFAAPRPDRPNGVFRPMHSTPQRKLRPVIWALSGPFLAPQKAPEFWVDKPFTRCLNRLAGVVISEPFGIDRRGPKHTRAEQVES